MVNKENLKIDTENVKKLFAKTSTKIVLSTLIGATVIASTVPFIIAEEKKQNEFLDAVSVVEYVVDDKEYDLKDLYYFEIDGETHLCRKELLSEESHLLENYAISQSLGYSVPIPFLGSNKEKHYAYFDVQSDNFVGSDLDDNIEISNVYSKVRNDFFNGQVKAEDITIDYIKQNVTNNNSK